MQSPAVWHNRRDQFSNTRDCSAASPAARDLAVAHDEFRGLAIVFPRRIKDLAGLCDLWYQGHAGIEIRQIRVTSRRHKNERFVALPV